MARLKFRCIFILNFFILQISGTGNVCSTDYQCLGGQKCHSEVCECDGNEVILGGRCVKNDGFCLQGEQVYFNGKCYKTVRVGEACSTNYQCKSGAVCSNGRCVCPTGSNDIIGRCVEQNGNCTNHQIFVQNRCYNLSKPGQTCQLDAQCIGGSDCMNAECKCPPKTTLINDVCKPTTTTTSICQFGQIFANGSCLNLVAPGDACVENAQCVDGASCTNAFCMCPEGLNHIDGYCRKLTFTDRCNEAESIDLNGQCVAIQKPGGYCQHSEQCLGGSVCINGYCSCPPDTELLELQNAYCYHEGNCTHNQAGSNGRCYDKVPIGGYCHITDQCMGGADCTYAALCQCPYGTQATNGNCRINNGTLSCADDQVPLNGTCVERVVPGNSCMIEEQCLDESNCINSVCLCPFGTRKLNGHCVPVKASLHCKATQLEIDDECLDYSSPGGSCVVNQQCLSMSTCPKGTCECSYGYTNVKGYCLKLEIERTTDLCRSNEVRINDYCYTKAYIGHYCIFNEQCQGGSTCLNNYCGCEMGSAVEGNRCLNSTNECPMNQIRIQERCYSTSQIGGPCQHSQQCLGGSFCELGKCECPEDSVQTHDYCREMSARCPPTQVPIAEQCFDKARISERCIYDEQCEGGSSCQQNVCICPNGSINQDGQCTENVNCQPYQVANNGVCLDSVSIGMRCNLDTQCIESAECKSVSSSEGSTCQCKAGTVFMGSSCVKATDFNCPASTVYVPERKDCFPLVGYGQFCSDSSQCMAFSICIAQFCQCPPGFQNTNNICRRSQGSIACVTDQVAIGGNCYPLAAPNSPCAFSQQCTHGSLCISGYCTCPFGTALENGSCQNTGRTPFPGLGWNSFGVTD